MIIKIKDIGTVVSGGTPSTTNPEYYNGDIVWFTPNDLSKQNSKYVKSGERLITKEGFKNCSATLIPPNNILLTSRAPIGLLAINTCECCTNQGFKSIIVDSSKCNVEYLYYFLKTRVKQLINLGSGTTFKELSKDSLENLEIDLPDKKRQDEIGLILSQLDAKIIVNNQVISELESLAKTIYDYWFLQFEFPNEEGMPYKSSGGKMIWSEELKREIPEGWGVGELQSKVQSKRIVLTPTQIPPSGKYVGLEHIPRKKVVLDDYGDVSTVESNKLLANDGDILFGKIRPYFHKVSITPWDVYCSSDALVLNSFTENDYAYVAFTLFSENFVRYATKSGNNGSKMPRAEWDALKKYPIYIPTENIMKLFNSLILPIIRQMKRIIVENKELTELRDYLLPMLMNGQVGFKE